MAFVIVLISFYCSVATGSPPLEAEYSASSEDSEPICIVIQNDNDSLSIEEILSTKKYLKRCLETAKKEGSSEESPEREHQPFVVEKEESSSAGEKDARFTVSTPGHPDTLVIREQSLMGEMKGTQTPVVDNIPLLVVTGQESPSPPAVEESITQTYAEDNKPLQSLTREEPAFTGAVEEMDYQEELPTDKSHQPTASIPQTPQETKEEITPITIATPKLYSETIAGEGSLLAKTKGTQTPAVDNKFHLITDDNGSPFTSDEETSYTATEAGSEALNKETKESQKEISSPEPPAETVKEAKDLNPVWDIWHTNPTLSIIIAVAITLIAAKIGGLLANMVMLPEVVGNLIVGIIFGNFFF